MTVGIDLVEVSRIEKSMKSPRFLTRVFGLSEQALFCGAHRAERAAANFAAKEAFGKALGTGVRGFSLNEVEVLRDPLGKPYFSLHGKAAALAGEKKLAFSVSLTHTKDYAQAIVIGYSEKS